MWWAYYELKQDDEKAAMEAARKEAEAKNR
jgi:hypothetical protein